MFTVGTEFSSGSGSGNVCLREQAKSTLELLMVWHARRIESSSCTRKLQHGPRNGKRRNKWHPSSITCGPPSEDVSTHRRRDVRSSLSMLGAYGGSRRMYRGSLRKEVRPFYGESLGAFRGTMTRRQKGTTGRHSE